MTIPDTAVDAMAEASPGTSPKLGPETVPETRLETRLETRRETRLEAKPEPAARTTSPSVPKTTPRSVLLLGATGRTGGRVLKQLLDRGIPVRAIVRSAERLPAGAGPRRVLTGTAAGTAVADAAATAATAAPAATGAAATTATTATDAPLTVVEEDLSAMRPEELRRHLQGCDTVISCLGHAPNLRGVYGPPRDLVEGAVRAVCEAASLKPRSPIRLILMSSVSVNRPARADTRRGAGERAFVSLVRALVPPARDNQRAADYLAREIGVDHPFVSWVVVRPDSLVEGEPSEYGTHDGLVASLFRPDKTRMANVARFMAELTSNEAAWRQWRGKMPVIVDETPEGMME